MEEPGIFDRIKAVLRIIPRGTVVSYGAVAAAAGIPRGARTVVWVLKGSKEGEGIPWHRVVNRHGCIAIRDAQGFMLQRRLLEEEGCIVHPDGRVEVGPGRTP